MLYIFQIALPPQYRSHVYQHYQMSKITLRQYHGYNILYLCCHVLSIEANDHSLMSVMQVLVHLVISLVPQLARIASIGDKVFMDI